MSDNLAKIIGELNKAQAGLEDLNDTFTYGGNVTLPKVDVKVKSDVSFRQIEKKLQQVNELAVQYMREEIEKALNEIMAANIWESGNDLIDTGELMNSLEVAVNGDTVTMSYTADYASLVHYGGYIQPYGNSKVEKVYIPGRPWVQAVVDGTAGTTPIDLSAIYNRAFKQIMG